MSVNVKKGDNVLILTGKDSGSRGRVTAVNVKSGRVVVDGYNTITRHKKARSAKETGGIEKISGTIDASNVQIVCPACSKATRVAITFVDGKEGEKAKKVRTCKKCGASLDAKVKAEKSSKKKTTKADAADAAEKPAAKKTAKKADDQVNEIAAEEKPAAKKAPAKKAAPRKTTAKADKSEE